MSYVIVGLGNPEKDYWDTRHNIGRILLSWIGESHNAEWKVDTKLNAVTGKFKIGKTPVTFLLPNTFMNKSGNSVKKLVTSSKQAEKLLVVYDDLDLPFGKNKISYNRSSGGHHGLESVIKGVKTEKFARIRIGISPTTPSGKMKKPVGEDPVLRLILGKFKPDELKALKKLSKKVDLAIENFVTGGFEKAMTGFN